MEEECQAASSMCTDLDMTWLLHRAAQRLADAVQAEAVQHGIGMRAQLILTALAQSGGRTQLALGADLVVDKTTLTTELDRLEGCGLIQRRPDPRDRRVRIPEITAEGRRRQAEAAESIKSITDRQLAVLTVDERKILEESLRRLIDSPVETPQPGVSRV